jgi:Concanavalin A-like lectin/glucanases superfamily
VTCAPVTVTVDNTANPYVGLVAAYSFDEGGGSGAFDSSGRASSGSVRSAARRTTAGKYGSALTFDGRFANVTVGDAPGLDLTGAMTLEAWVKPSELGGWRDVIFKEGYGVPFAYGLYASDRVGPGARLRVGDEEQSLTGPSALPVGVWTHIAATYDGFSMRVWVNAPRSRRSRARAGSGRPTDSSGSATTSPSTTRASRARSTRCGSTTARSARPSSRPTWLARSASDRPRARSGSQRGARGAPRASARQ